MTKNTMRDGRGVPSSTDPATASPVREGAQHTPGPWHVSERHSGSLIDVKARGLVVARVLVLSADPAADPEHEAEENARLIAAAPDLLAALKGMLDQPESPDSYDAMIDRALAAIAKAEGK